MPAAGALKQRLVLVCAATAYAVVFSAFVLGGTERGIAQLFYVPICLVALVSDELRGAAAGVVAAALYSGALLLMPNVPATALVTSSALLSFVTFAGIGGLLGWYANRHRVLVGELRQQALRDSLTGIGNEELFEQQLARRCALGRPFTLVLADLDGLGLINDAHGLEAGNAALRRVGEALRDLAWPTDDVARIAGDEFALLTHLSVEDAAHLATRLTRRLMRQHLSLGFGTTAYPDDGATATELLRKAEDRLFAAKLVGENRRAFVASATL